MLKTKQIKRHRCEGTSNPIVHVLVSPELVEHITSYQNGIHQDMARFLALKPKKIKNRLKKRISHVEYVHQIFTPWLKIYGYKRLNKLFISLKYTKTSIVLNAISKHNMELLFYLHEHFNLNTFRGNLIDVASHYNNIQALMYLINIGHHGCTKHAMNSAASHGNIQMVAYLNQHRPMCCSNKALALATLHGHRNVVDYIQQQNLATYDKDWLLRAIVHKVSIVNDPLM